MLTSLVYKKTQLKLETSVQCKMTTIQIDYGPDACKFPKFVRMIKSRRINTKKRAENGKTTKMLSKRLRALETTHFWCSVYEM